MSHRKLFLVLTGAVLICTTLFAQDAPTKPKLNILRGPATAKLGGVAQINLPEGFTFLDGATTRSIMKAYGEPVSGKELGLIEATNDHWSVIFEFADIGYVKDDDKDKLDADKMLASFKEGTAEQNKERVAMGRAPLEIVGWEQPPHYDDVSHNLTWAIRCTSEGRQILNYNTRLLGRLGVMEVVLICEPEQLQGTLPTFTNLLAGYSFQVDQNYSSYRKGDKVAKYGLAALVLGGAAVGAAKLGLLAWLLPFLKKGWIIIVGAVAAVAKFFRNIFRKITGRGDDDRRT